MIGMPALLTLGVSSFLMFAACRQTSGSLCREAPAAENGGSCCTTGGQRYAVQCGAAVRLIRQL